MEFYKEKSGIPKLIRNVTMKLFFENWNFPYKIKSSTEKKIRTNELKNIFYPKPYY